MSDTRWREFSDELPPWDAIIEVRRNAWPAGVVERWDVKALDPKFDTDDYQWRPEAELMTPVAAPPDPWRAAVEKRLLALEHAVFH